MAARNAEKKYTKARKDRQLLKRQMERAAFAKNYRGHKLTARELEFLMRMHT